MTLTAKQELFVSEYMEDLNATQAAIRAGYSEHSARAIGHENLTKPDIADAIIKAKAEVKKRFEITQDSLAEMHIEAYKLAKELDIPSTMTTAATNLGKLTGLHVDKAAVKHEGLKVTLESDAAKL
jgi:phage terminase small subunit